jgi:medium-chain acyl-[acyl-carrier-protein] hydrolase
VQAAYEALQSSLDIPFALFGHSMGALIAFEFARHLRNENGPEPVCLIVSGRSAPQSETTDPPTHKLPDPEFIENLRKLNGTPEAVLQSSELMSLMMPQLRADFELCETYLYSAQEPLRIPIRAFGGLDDREVSREKIEAWKEQTSRSFNLKIFPGDHFFIHSSRELILQAIYRELLL